MSQGLSSVADQLSSYGRGSDTMLAHISPQEAKLIDYMQGGRRTNPMTGLPEYGLFGKILKTIARVAGGVVGFALGGPAGAALGNGLVTKATGGSWNDALKSGALSGLGSFAAQGLSGGGWSPTGNGTALSNALAGSSGASGAGIGGGLGSAGAQLAAFNGTEPPSMMSQLGTTAMSAPGIAAGIPGLASDAPKPAAPLTPLPPGPGINLDVLPFDRGYQPYTGDYAHYGEGPGHQFFKNVNPIPQLRSASTPALAPTAEQKQLESGFMARGGPVRRYAGGGGVDRSPDAYVYPPNTIFPEGHETTSRQPMSMEQKQQALGAIDKETDSLREDLIRGTSKTINAKIGGVMGAPDLIRHQLDMLAGVRQGIVAAPVTRTNYFDQENQRKLESNYWSWPPSDDASSYSSGHARGGPVRHMAEGGAATPSMWDSIINAATGYSPNTGDLHVLGALSGGVGLANPIAGLALRGGQFIANKLGWDPVIHMGGGSQGTQQPANTGYQGPDMSQGPPTEFIPQRIQPNDVAAAGGDNNSGEMPPGDIPGITVHSQQTAPQNNLPPQGWEVDPFNHASDAAYYGQQGADQLRDMSTGLQQFHDNYGQFLKDSGIADKIAAYQAANGGGQAAPAVPATAAPASTAPATGVGNPLSTTIAQIAATTGSTPPAGNYTPFAGDYSHYGEGPEHMFIGHARGGRIRRRYALGGGVMGPQMMQGPGAPSVPAMGLRGPGAPGQGIGMPNPGQQTQQQQAHRVQMLGMLQGMASGGPVGTPPFGPTGPMTRTATMLSKGNPPAPPSPAAQMGTVRGPGGPRADRIPAMLSSNEHVFDAATVKIAGGGNYAKGHQVIQNIKTQIRRQAGIKKPRLAPTARAMSRAGFGVG